MNKLAVFLALCLLLSVAHSWNYRNRYNRYRRGRYPWWGGYSSSSSDSSDGGSSGSSAVLGTIVKPSTGVNTAFASVGSPAASNWGAENEPFRRIGGNSANSYDDGLDTFVVGRPNPRTVSNIVGEQTTLPVTNSRLGLSILFTFMGQFVDHDLTLALPNPVHADIEVMNITIPAGDTSFTPGSQLLFERNNKIDSDAATNTPRQQINTQSSILDLTQVYGANSTVANELRAPQGGRLLSSNRAGEEDLLPRYDQFDPSLNAQLGDRFRGGDERTTENMALLTLQTLFFREHNRLADRFMDENNWDAVTDDELIYQAARNYNIAQWSKIIMYDWLPNLIGAQKHRELFNTYTGPTTVDPTLPNEFSAAAFRIGHTLLINNFPQIKSNDVVESVFRLRDMFERIDVFNSERVDLMLRGLTRTFAKEKSRSIIDDVRNFLFLAPNFTVQIDLFAFNLQRGRDHGLQDYRTLINTVNTAFGATLDPVNSFSDITSDPVTVNRLDMAYNSDINLIDPWVGIICEDAVDDDAVFGPLGAEIVGRSFANIRNADRFWWERSTEVAGEPAIFPTKIRNEIRYRTIAKIIRENTGIEYDEIEKNALFVRGRQPSGNPNICFYNKYLSGC